MSEQNKSEVKQETGVDIERVTFDENGELIGLDEAALDDVAGGLAVADSNKGCGNSVNGSC
jgi:hypothetical protein